MSQAWSYINYEYGMDIRLVYEVREVVDKIGVYQRRVVDGKTCSSDLCFEARFYSSRIITFTGVLLMFWESAIRPFVDCKISDIIEYVSC